MKKVSASQAGKAPCAAHARNDLRAAVLARRTDDADRCSTGGPEGAAFRERRRDTSNSGTDKASGSSVANSSRV